MKFLNKLSCAFSSGCIGAVALLVTLVLWHGMPNNFASFKPEIYRLLIWGGIWALLMIIPIWKTHWFIRGSVLGIIVILFNFIVLMPLSGHGFFASKAGSTLFIANIVLNYIWGVVASAWFRLCNY